MKPVIGHSLTIAVLSLVLALFSSAASAYEVILDGEDTAFRVAAGNWQLDKTGSFQGNFRYSAAGPGDGSSIAVWDIDSIPDGTYLVEFYVDDGDYAATAEYAVEDDSGIATKICSQNHTPGWNSIGTFTFTGAGRITQTDHWTGAGTKVIADALRLTYSGTPPSARAGSAPPEVTLVIDDLGALNPNQSGTYTNTLFDEAPDVTYAVMPELTYTHDVIAAAHTKNIGTILHQPMEYIGGSTSGDPTRLYINMSPSEILSTLNSNILDLKPVASDYILDGMNNHQGSRFSQYRPGLEVAIQDLKDRGMFFLDSRTISDSVAYDIAREKGLLTGERDLFVDGATVANTLALIESVAQRALYKPNYNYIMICHQRPNTVPGVLQALPVLENWGVEIKPLIENMHYIVETDKIPPGAAVEVVGPWISTAQDMISHECFDGDALVLPNSVAGSVTFRPNLPRDGQYRVFVGNRFTNATITHKDGSITKPEPSAQHRHDWAYLGSYPFNAGTAGSVKLDTSPARIGSVVADAVKFVYDGPQDTSDVPQWSEY